MRILGGSLGRRGNIFGRDDFGFRGGRDVYDIRCGRDLDSCGLY